LGIFWGKTINLNRLGGLSLTPLPKITEVKAADVVDSSDQPAIYAKAAADTATSSDQKLQRKPDERLRGEGNQVKGKGTKKKKRA
jgi:hypothetical protein